MFLADYEDCFGEKQLIFPLEDQDKEESLHPFPRTMQPVHSMIFPGKRKIIIKYTPK